MESYKSFSTTKSTSNCLNFLTKSSSLPHSFKFNLFSKKDITPALKALYPSILNVLTESEFMYLHCCYQMTGFSLMSKNAGSFGIDVNWLYDSSLSPAAVICHLLPASSLNHRGIFCCIKCLSSCSYRWRQWLVQYLILKGLTLFSAIFIHTAL